MKRRMTAKEQSWRQWCKAPVEEAPPVKTPRSAKNIRKGARHRAEDDDEDDGKPEESTVARRRRLKREAESSATERADELSRQASSQPVLASQDTMSTCSKTAV